uniref:Bgt-20830-2 n=1 Tax=Blumeria graminis f. sp. tritici 96224 TaxID=1268274 RepID=A0A381LAJ9_BLUGR
MLSDANVNFTLRGTSMGVISLVTSFGAFIRAALAGLSAISFPSIPECPSIHRISTD